MRAHPVDDCRGAIPGADGIVGVGCVQHQQVARRRRIHHENAAVRNAIPAVAQHRDAVVQPQPCAAGDMPVASGPDPHRADPRLARAGERLDGHALGELPVMRQGVLAPDQRRVRPGRRRHQHPAREAVGEAPAERPDVVLVAVRDDDRVAAGEIAGFDRGIVVHTGGARVDADVDDEAGRASLDAERRAALLPEAAEQRDLHRSSPASSPGMTQPLSITTSRASPGATLVGSSTSSCSRVSGDDTIAASRRK